MKLILISLLLFVSSASAIVITLDIALEMESFDVEYSEISKTGLIRVVDCSDCTKKIYTFDDNIIIKKQGNIITLEEFMQDYWNAKYPALFANKDDLSIMRITY